MLEHIQRQLEDNSIKTLLEKNSIKTLRLY
jgi:hypothetical protein